MAKNNDDIKVTKGSGNVYADLGLDNADELLYQSHLGFHIRQIIKDRGYKQSKAAAIMGATQPEISHLMNGRYSLFTEGRLLGFLNRLDYDVQLRISPAAQKGAAKREVQMIET
jgi:predicted XRE-type DNA-binding protein